MKKILFIINPISGKKRKNKKSRIPKLIDRNIDKSKFEYKIRYTEYPLHATEIAKQGISDNFNIIVAVGGDGTVNEVSKALINKKTVMGIIPLGSGNGLARYLDIPLLPSFAIRNINKERYKKIDSLIVDGINCANLAGIGFDARIAHLFADHGKRGFRSYLDIILNEFHKYKGEKVKLKFNDEEVERQAFLVSFANSTQFGNAAHIAPNASASDGFIDISILKKFPLAAGIEIGSRLFMKNIDKSKYMESFKAKKISIELPNSKNQVEGHIDGEPVIFNNPFSIEINQHSLKILKGISLKPAGRKVIRDIKQNIQINKL